MLHFDDAPVPFPPDAAPGNGVQGDFVPGSPTGSGLGGWLESVLFSGSFFAVFFIVVAVLIAAGIATTVVMLIRGKGRRYVMMSVDDDGTMRPVAMRGMGIGRNAGLDMHNAAHQQAVQQAMQQNQQMTNQQQFPPGT